MSRRPITIFYFPRPGRGENRDLTPAGWPLDTIAPSHDASHKNHPGLRRRSGDARDDRRDPRTGLSGPDSVDRRSRVVAPPPGGGRRDAAGRPTARHQRLRRPSHRQGELQPGRVHHDLGDQRSRDRRAGDEARGVSLHHQELRLRRTAVARAQCLRAAGSQSPGHDAQRAGGRAERSRVPHRAEQAGPRDRRARAQGGAALGDGA